MHLWRAAEPCSNEHLGDEQLIQLTPHDRGPPTQSAPCQHRHSWEELQELLTVTALSTGSSSRHIPTLPSAVLYLRGLLSTYPVRELGPSGTGQLEIPCVQVHCCVRVGLDFMCPPLPSVWVPSGSPSAPAFCDLLAEHSLSPHSTPLGTICLLVLFLICLLRIQSRDLCCFKSTTLPQLSTSPC